jgi:hypothetical protein
MGYFQGASENMHIENPGDKKYLLCLTEIYVSATQIGSLFRLCAGPHFLAAGARFKSMKEAACWMWR